MAAAQAYEFVDTYIMIGKKNNHQARHCLSVYATGESGPGVPLPA